MIKLKGKKKKGTRRSSYRPKKRLEKRIDFVLHFLRRFGLVLGAVVFVLWAGAWLYWSGSFAKAGNWAREASINMAAEQGFTVANIMVEGRVNTDPAVLLGLVNMREGDPLFAFNPSEAKEMIERISWVKSVQVERRLPDTIYIALNERKPLAIYMRKTKGPVLIDGEGEALTDYNLERFSDLITISGAGGNKAAAALIELLESEPEVMSRVAKAEWVGRRRWNIVTDNGTQIRLPEEDAGLALRHLAIANEDKALLEQKIIYIDLRHAGRIVLKNAPGEVKEYKAGYKTDANL